MNRLERCLKDIPKGCELLVSLDANNQSTLHLLRRGVFDEQLDMMFLDINEEENRAKSFPIKNVLGHSEGF